MSQTPQPQHDLKRPAGYFYGILALIILSSAIIDGAMLRHHRQSHQDNERVLQYHLGTRIHTLEILTETADLRRAVSRARPDQNETQNETIFPNEALRQALEESWPRLESEFRQIATTQSRFGDEAIGELVEPLRESLDRLHDLLTREESSPMQWATILDLVSRVEASAKLLHESHLNLQTIAPLGETHRISESQVITFSTVVLTAALGTVLLLHHRAKRSLKAIMETTQKLVQSESRYRTLVDQAADGILVADANGQYVDANDAICHMLGYSREELLEKTIPGMISKEDLEAKPIAFDNLQKGQTVVRERRLRRKDGSFISVEISSRQLPDGYIQGIHRDLTERKLAEAELRQSQARLAILIEHVPDVVLYETGDGREFVSENVRDLLGYTAQQIVARQPHFEDLINKDDQQKNEPLIKKWFAEGNTTPLMIQFRATRADGSTIWLEDRVNKVRINDGQNYFTGVLIDISDRKAAEDSLRIHAQQQAVMAELSSMAVSSHDLPGLMDEAVRQLAETMGVEYTKMLQTEPDGEHLLLRAGVGWKTGLVGHAVVPTGQDSQAGYTLNTHKPVVVHNLKTDERFCGPTLLTDHGVISGISVLIGEVDHPWGILGIHSTRMIEFSTDDVNFIQSVANLLAHAISRTTAEDALRASEAQVRLLLDSTAEAILGLDLKGRCTFCNPACLRMLGYEDPKELLGRDMHETIQYQSHDQSIYPRTASRILAALEKGEGIHAEDEVLWCRDDRSFPVEYWSYPIRRENHLLGSVVTFVDITKRKQSEKRQQFMMRELDHRVKNNLASILALAQLSINTTDSVDDFIYSFAGRISAMARTHEALAQKKWEGADIAGVVRRILHPYQRHDPNHVRLSGESITLPARIAPPLGLALHELATNAAKYGSLSTDTGVLDVTWEIDDDHQITLVWTERQGPPAHAPKPDNPGLGTRLISGLIEQEIGGTLDWQFSPDGLSCMITIPLNV